ncbi:MAG TPA: disulfide bond formation protein B [Candidatus Limnocylindria bacterium]|nr:disulfide bond formation protein B [Candidatus Limnocylindria bacterium]
MSVEVVSTFLALLALGAGFGVLATLTLWVLDRIGLVPGAMDGFTELVRPAALWLAFLVAAVAMAGSLYFSIGAGFVPCDLCWYQRIAMYPLAPILAVAALRRDPRVAWYAVPVALIGAALSIYHIGVERLPGMPSAWCSLQSPCNVIWVERFGFVTIPTMALLGFLAIVTLLLVYARPAPAAEETRDHLITNTEPIS